MLRRLVITVALVAALQPARTATQDGARNQDPGEYRLRLPVDEVVLTFNALDAQGFPVHDLKAEEVRLWDNGAVPRKVLAFDELRDRPIRLGILMDTSESMRRALSKNQEIAWKFVERLFRQKSDAAFVLKFGFTSELVQPWTEKAPLLLRAVGAGHESGHTPRGTALFNAVFKGCSSSFAKVDPTAMGNLILLFSDGEDNAGLTSVDEAARACQQSNTQIFAFLPASVEQQPSTGPKMLRELTAKTGGQVFVGDDSEDAIWKDLKAIDSQMRNQYRLVYNPANFKHDGAFHEILVQPPDRVSRVEVRSGYFAPRP